MREPAANPRPFKGYVMDLDGVIYRGKRLLPGAREFIALLRARSRKIIFLSNASFGSRAAIAAKLRALGVACSDGEVINSGYVAAQYVKRRFGKCPVFLVGEKGLKDELRAAGVQVRKKGACAVVAGFDSKITYEKIADALDLLLAGVPFIASNSDATYPVENRLLPGAGMIVGALEGCSGRKALVLGKPNPLMVRACLSSMKLKPHEVAVVGDRLETDILMANEVGAYSILVLTGVSSRKHAQAARGMMKPKLVVKDLRALGP
ncbi:Haloacid dehalogenase-like hydrolase [Candidatus Burarchaeum australiense]|nr:Haloacid dehalogenase-like hydrolase [Candidatus Burarchaeum australiense]